jgi:hypothetical protein
MKFSTVVDIRPLAFQPVYLNADDSKKYFIITNTHVRAGEDLFVEDYSPPIKTTTFFTVSQVSRGKPSSQDGALIGALFYTEYHARCMGSSIVAYSKIHLDSVQLGDMKVAGELVVKTPLVFGWHAPNIATLFSNPKAPSKLHDALTSL